MLINLIYSFFITISVICLTVVYSLIAALISLFDTSGNKIHSFCAIKWGKALLFSTKIKVKGLSNIDIDKSYIYMPNHQSLYDIPVLYAYIPTNFRWLAKKEAFRIPFLGCAMKLAGHISIDRKDRYSAIESLKKASELLKKNPLSIIIFPEGTRSYDGKIAPFKKGGFYLSVASQLPIVPVIIKGTREIISKKSLLIKPGKVELEFLEPIDTAVYTKENKDELLNKVRNIMIEKYESSNQNV